jgi:DNA-directed RNA polymerase sigma subunit (sigma70/sigma32)
MAMNANAQTLVNLRLEDLPETLTEATVRLPPRSHRWIAVYMGQEPGEQVAKSTGLTDRQAALELARKWEAEARQRRVERQRRPGAGIERIEPGGLSQRQVAAILGLSPRSVRAIERRGLRKLRRHPAVRQMWKEFGRADLPSSLA